MPPPKKARGEMSRMTHSKCGECRNFFECDSACENDFACADFEQQGKSIFDRITTSPEVLAPKFVYHVTSFLDGLDKPKKIWYSTIIQGRFFDTETEAKRATVARLKEVEK